MFLNNVHVPTKTVIQMFGLIFLTIFGRAAALMDKLPLSTTHLAWE
jgi:hypothetical protein